jgi:hypothetical protein
VLLSVILYSCAIYGYINKRKALAVTYLMGYILPTINAAAAARVKYGTLCPLLGGIKIAFISQLRERRTVSHIKVTVSCS